MPFRMWRWLDDRGTLAPFGRLLRMIWPRLHYCVEMDGLLVVGEPHDYRCECVPWPTAWADGRG